MEECLGSIHFNENAELILSSSYLTYQHWIGFVGLMNKPEIDDIVKSEKSCFLSSLKTGKSNDSGVSQARWISNERFVAGTDNGEVILYKVNKEEPENMYETVMVKQEHDSLVLSLATNLNSNIALSGSSDTRIKVWNLNDELSINTFKGHEGAVCSLTMNPKCTDVFLSCSEDNTALFWDLRKEKPASLIPHQFKGYPSSSAWSSLDANLIALGAENGQLAIFDVRNMKLDQSFAMIKSNNGYIRRVEFNPRKNVIAIAAEDCKTQVYKLNNSSVLNESNLEKIYENKNHMDYVTDIAWNPLDFSEYLTSSWDGTLKNHKIEN